MKYRIPDSDKELVRSCFEAAEDVLRDLRANPVEGKIRSIRIEEVSEYRIAIARMLLELDIEARKN